MAKAEASSKIMLKRKKFGYVLGLLNFFTHFFLIILIGAMGIGIGIGIGVFQRFRKEIPDIETVLAHKPAMITNCYSRNGKVFARFYVEKREVIPLQKINPLLKKASLAVEDLRFYQHKGIDVVGILRAMRTNLLAGRIVQGGSTITQQLARTLFLSREKKYSRKIKEAILSLEIEQTLTKSQILEKYFNEIYFGHGCYGIQAAAKTFFGKDNKELDLAECALLAGLPKAPTIYSPYQHPTNARNRRYIVLTRMLEAGFISKKDFDEAINEPFNLKTLKHRRGDAPYFEEYLRRKLEARFGSEMVHKGGLKVYTTLDIGIQKTAQKALKWGLHEYSRRQGWKGVLPENVRFPESDDFPAPGLYGIAQISKVTKKEVFLTVSDYSGIITWKEKNWTNFKDPDKILHKGDRILISIETKNFDRKNKKFFAQLEQIPKVEGAVFVMDTHTGDILAMVGGYSFERSQFNRVTQAIRQPGSAFKPIVYSTALDNNYTASTILYDAPIVEEYENEDDKKKLPVNEKKIDDKTSEEEKPKLWKPENYDETFLGPMTLRVALEKSRNLMTIRLLRKLGVTLVSRYARSYGITTHIEENLSMALGSSGVLPIEIASVYAMFANQGIRNVPHGIKSVFSRDKTLLWENVDTQYRVLDKRIAFLITYLMQGVIEHGTGRKAAFLNRPMAGKTGTTNEFKDAWFIGFTPDVVVAAWVGFDDSSSLGHKESGSRAALPIWIKVMKSLLPEYGTHSFIVPKGIEFAMIDKKTGLLATKHSQNVIREAYLAGKAPTSFAPSKNQISLTQKDLSTNLIQMEELSDTEDNQPEEKENPFSGYPPFE